MSIHSLLYIIERERERAFSNARGIERPAFREVNHYSSSFSFSLFSFLPRILRATLSSFVVRPRNAARFFRLRQRVITCAGYMRECSMGISCVARVRRAAMGIFLQRVRGKKRNEGYWLFWIGSVVCCSARYVRWGLAKFQFYGWTSEVLFGVFSCKFDVKCCGWLVTSCKNSW